MTDLTVIATRPI